MGCNYWASHAGTDMWNKWDESVIDDDFRRLSHSGIRLLRIFPLWSDFQPLKMLFGGGGSEREIRFEGDELLPFTEEGRAGIDPVMAERFGILCSAAEKYGISLIVALVTGWMSGRLYVPRLFERVNVLTDPRAIKWEVRFVQYLVRRFRGEKSVIAWELGNECNCMGGVGRDSAYLWAKTITMAVKEIDNSRPVISGMHGLIPSGSWTPEDQGEITDLLTTHPYPLFTPYCNTDPLISMKSALHASAESVMYAGIGGKPCFVEEAGALGPMIASDENTAKYVKASAMTAWAYGLKAFIWWCANEQSHLTHAPYDWNSVERELGVFYADRQPKPVLGVMKALQCYFDGFKYELPEPVCDAVCILTRGQDMWTAAYGAFILAKQAGLDITFRYVDDELPDADVYMLPSLNGDSSFSRHTCEFLLDKVRNGATLYLSLDKALLSPFASFSGVMSEYRSTRYHEDDIAMPGGSTVRIGSDIDMRLRLTTGEAVLTASDGNPALIRNSYGTGTVWTLNYPIECIAAVSSGVTDSNKYLVYSVMMLRSKKKAAAVGDSRIGLTEHIISEDRHILVLINYGCDTAAVDIKLDGGWSAVDFVPLDSEASLDGVKLTLTDHSAAAVVIENRGNRCPPQKKYKDTEK